jgi:hypothetical protein
MGGVRVPGRAAIIGGTLSLLALGGYALAQERALPPTSGDFPVSAPVVPAEPGWPRTAFQVPPDLPPLPAPRPVTNPLQEPPLSPFLPQTPAPTNAAVPLKNRVTLPRSPRQKIEFSPRYEQPGTVLKDILSPSEERFTYLGGVIFNVTTQKENGTEEVELATDTAVAWVRTVQSEGDEGGSRKEVEIYLAGDVVIRTRQAGAKGPPVEQVLRSEEIYYDVTRNRSIALDAELESRGGGLPDSVHIRSPKILRLGQNEWRATDAITSSSKRPADPNLTVRARESRLTFERGPRRNVFGIPYRDFTSGEVVEGYERTLTTTHSTVRVVGVPVFYTPRAKTDLAEPLGPLAGISFGNDNIFGFQLYTTWDIHKLLAVRPPNGHRWTLETDYLSERGPAFGTSYSYRDPSFLGVGGPQDGLFKIYAIRDEGADQLGGFRGPQPLQPGDFAPWMRQAASNGLIPPLPPESNDYWRGRLLWRHNQELYEEGVSWLRLQAQVAYLSDKNFLEQYYKQEFDMGANQETFAYLHGSMGNLWGQTWVQPNLERRWVTETEWLPRVDGALIGESLFGDRLIYSGRATMGYANLIPTQVDPAAVLPTDQERISAGRFDLYNRLSVPFDLGAIRFEPYGVLDAAYYSNTLEQQALGYTPYDGLGGIRGLPGQGFTTNRAEGTGRFYGGGGISASTTFSKVFADASSELMNVRGLNHKITPSLNYFAGYSDTAYNRLPQFDRMFNDSLDQGYRNMRPIQAALISDGSNAPPGPNAIAAQESPAFDPQQLAIRRLVEGRPDTLDTMQVVQAELRQRLQTKRGFPGAEHTVDWMSLDLSASYYPDPQRDNYGQSWAFLEYAYLWHLGDRFALFTNGWYEPLEFGARYYNVGMNINRPDGTNFVLSYRYTDPIDSRLATAGLNYRLSTKYSLNFTTSYDFGTQESLVNSVAVARTGTDMTLLFGLTYNSILNNFGFQFSLAPNAVGNGTGRLTQFSPGGLGAGR